MSRPFVAVVAQSTGNDHIVPVRADGLIVVQLRGAHDRIVDVQELAIPPHVFGWAAASHPRAQSSNQLFPVHGIAR